MDWRLLIVQQTGRRDQGRISAANSAGVGVRHKRLASRALTRSAWTSMVDDP
jgi:hypothetical protein